MLFNEQVLRFWGFGAMMKFFEGVVFACLLTASTPIAAASVETNLFMANVRSNLAFLDQSSKLASTHTKSTALRAFAKTEIAETFRLAEMLDGVSPTRLATMSPDKDVVITGRSVAVASGADQAANGRVALSQQDVARLARLEGRGFDDALWLKLVDALSQLRADYETYAASGDDAVLVAVAKRELPKVEARLLALSKI